MNTVLVCDDEKDIVSALKIYLESEGYAVECAYDGAQALALRLHLNGLFFRAQAAALAGAPVKVKVREAGDEPVHKKNTAVDELIGRAKAFDIQVKEL